jgi:predicted dehydrogenase
MRSIRLMTVAPGHFHAALVQKKMLEGVNRRSYVYAPLDSDLIAHLDRLAAFNSRPEEPTDWEVEVRAGSNFLERFLHEQPGNTVVLSGRNRPKIDLMHAAVSNGLHVLADKPWIIDADDFPRLEDLLREAESREVLVWDMLTERHEVTTRLQRELIRDAEIFGDWLVGSTQLPALSLTSVHHLKKSVAGRPLRRPWWWFDAAVSGEALADVGTHLVDLAMGLAFPGRTNDHRTDVAIIDADRWPLVLSPKQFTELTGLPSYPPELAGRLVEDQLYYAGNNTADITLHGLHVKLTALWEYEAPAGGGDSHEAIARGSKSTVAVRQTPEGVPEVLVTPADRANASALLDLLRKKCKGWQRTYTGVEVEERGTDLWVKVPDALRVGHEAHFAEVMEEFVRYFITPRAVPPWERTNALSRYFITTQAIALARQKRPLPR